MPVSSQDREQLQWFIRSLSDLLRMVIQDEMYVIPSAGHDLFNAWEFSISRFTGLEAMITHEQIDELLEELGLSGTDLRPKIVGYQSSLRLFSRIGGRRLLLRVLEWADIILG